MILGVAVLALGPIVAAPHFAVSGDLPQNEVTLAADQQWSELESIFTSAGGELPTQSPATIQIRRRSEWDARVNGRSGVGWVELRLALASPIGSPFWVALRHELAHQFLGWACPRGATDALLQESFAVSTSGELANWSELPYQSLSRAQIILEQSNDLNLPSVREALIRVLSEQALTEHLLPKAIAQKLSRCAGNAGWDTPLKGIDLIAEPSHWEGRVASTVVISRHSGEVLFQEGDPRMPLPFGSTLKPFIIAGSSLPPPTLPVRPGQQEWLCGSSLGRQISAPEALLRSCNGYFLDWGLRTSSVAQWGEYGPLLTKLGIGRLPSDVSEAIGLRASLSLSPWAMAQAYRVLAETRPDLIDLLHQNASQGTLAGLASSNFLRGVATKTGTVRDAQSNPVLGWIVVIDKNFVAVRVSPGKAPRTFAGEIVTLVKSIRQTPGQEKASVQVFGLVDPRRVEVSCRGIGLTAILNPKTPLKKLELIEPGFGALWENIQKGTALCLGAPWRVRFPQRQASDYAGSFIFSPLASHPLASTPEDRARLGSEIIFHTSQSRYTSGVLEAEDSSLRGEPRKALAQVIAHNLDFSRHPGRPVCDTTHCQAFKGTVAARREDFQALNEQPLPWRRWLNFSQGGHQPWKVTRPIEIIEQAIGRPVDAMKRQGANVALLSVQSAGSGGTSDHIERLPCEVIRSPLHLPSCPDQAKREGNFFVFWGQGKGHGEGLDVESLKHSRAPAKVILADAYGLAPVH